MKNVLRDPEQLRDLLELQRLVPVLTDGATPVQHPFKSKRAG